MGRSTEPFQRSSPVEKGVVGGEVLRGLLRKPLLLARPERGTQRLRHLRRDLRLHLKHVRNRRVERLLPLGRRRSGRDTSTSSGLTWTRLVPPLFSQRTVAVRRYETFNSSAICFGVFVVFL